MSVSLCRLVCYIDSLGYYIGDAERVAAFVQRPVFDVIRTSEWSVEQPSTSLILIQASNQQNLWHGLRTLGKVRRRRDPIEPIEQEIFLLMPCGHSAHYMAFDDVPASSVRCPCGDPKHWIIRYQTPEITSYPAL